ncbi:TadE/TadG family type IV pilus assembly protein [Aestuariibius insulae]|uniref:TadE/TadG family type IV pilus assembly protein n=1 Tax=Aestuariibius insulae TaxID=2058287 RepID=UPI00345E300C
MKKSLAKFRSEQAGNISIETLIIFPLLAWGFLACFIFFDAYRQKTLNTRMADTIADVVSRESVVGASFIDGMYSLQQYLARSENPPALRISTISYDKDDDEYEVEWSKARGGLEELTNADIPNLTDKLPILSSDDTFILVQTKTDHAPFFNVGLPAFELSEFIPVSPRGSPRVCYESCPATPADGTVETDEPTVAEDDDENASDQ